MTMEYDMKYVLEMICVALYLWKVELSQFGSACYGLVIHQRCE